MLKPISRDEADLLYEAGDLAAAGQVFSRLLEHHAAEPSWCLFQLGRIAAQQARWTDAIAYLDAALQANDPVIWAHWEKAAALEQIGADLKSIVSELAAFAQAAPEQLADEHYARLRQAAHDAVRGGCTTQAARLYDLVIARNQSDDLCRLRQADLRVLASFPAEAPAEIEPPGRAARWAADRFYEAGDHASAEPIFDLLCAATTIDLNWNRFQLGRIAMRQERWADAIDRLDAALATDDPIVWAHWEKATALQRLHAGPAAIAAELAQFASRAPEQLSDDHYRILARVAHGAFEAPRPIEARVLYDLLIARGQGGALCQLRRAELRVHAGEAAEALEILNRIVVDPDTAIWYEAVKARALVAVGRLEQAEAVIKPLVMRAPHNVDFVRILFTVFERGDDADQLAAPDGWLVGLTAEQRFEFLLRARLHCRDYPGIARLYADHPGSVSRMHEGIIVRAMNEAIGRADYELASRLFWLTNALATEACGIVSTMIAAYHAQKDWIRAAHLLDGADEILRKTRHPVLRLRKLEYYCFTLQLEAARELVDRWRDEGPLPDIAATAAAALYAALSHWDDVIAIFAEAVAQHHRVDQQTLLEAVARAARRTRRYAEILILIERAMAVAAHPRLLELHAGLLAEIQVVQALQLPGAPVFVSHAAPAGTAHACRAALLSAAVTDRSPPPPDRVIYFCTDANYLVGTCVAVFSLLRNNIGLRGRYRLSVVCSEAVAGFGRDVLGAIGAAFAVPIEIVSAASLVARGSSFQTGWGLFTPGHMLSEAAYYRIFMARHLLDRDLAARRQTGGRGGRALYLDSDLCVGPGVQNLLEAELDGAALGARPELPLPEIRRAALSLGLDSETYFNSGVLLFDLAHPDLSSTLAHTVEIALHRHDILTFLDQCALNLAFEGRVRLLPERFNSFIREATELPAADAQPVVWHFLDRPKPWDPLYNGPNGMLWTREFSMLGEVLSPVQMRYLLARQFEQKLMMHADSRTGASPVAGSR